MPNFQGSVLGRLVTLLGWDGSAFQNVKVDSDGHPQVDALTAQLITGFATETTLGLVKDRLGALTSPASGSANKLLTDILASLPDQLVGFTSVYREQVQDLDATAGSNTLSGVAVEANVLHIVTSIAAFDSTSSITSARISIVGDGTARSVMRVGGLAANVSINYQGRLILDEGDYIQAMFGGVTLNDNIFLVAHGWKASV